MTNSSRAAGSRKPQKPAKPYPGFPLYPHANGRWAKKVKGKTVFFGKWDDWQGALEKYQHDMPFLIRGVCPPEMTPQLVSMRDLCNQFLNHKKSLVETGELSQRSWDDLKRMADLMISHFGKEVAIEALRPLDFEKFRSELAKGRSVTTLNNLVARASCFFNFASKSGMVTTINRGLSFRRPSKTALKKAKQSRPQRLYTLDELKVIYSKATPTMRCFILLSLNGGLGNNDIGQLEHRHIISGKWINYPRPKTAVDRRFPLWPETEKAIENCMQKENPESPFVFLTKYGQQWAKETPDSPISKEFAKVLKLLDKEAVEDASERNVPPPTHKYHQAGRGFYALRHQFRTIADGCRDQVAINHIMGHADDSMAANYREHIDDDRLQAVVDHVRAWALPILVAIDEKIIASI